MIEIEKFKEFDKSLNEMAAGLPVGMVIKLESKDRLGYEEYHRWSTYYPKQVEKAKDGGVLFAKITQSGKQWLYADVLYTNCLFNPVKKIKLPTSAALTPGKLYKIFENKEKDIKDSMGKTFYLDGTEAGITNIEGGKVENFKEGEYFINSLNFTLSESQSKPVFCLFLKISGSSGRRRGSDLDANEKAPAISIPLDELGNLTKELSKEQQEVIAGVLAKKLGTSVEYIENEGYAFEKIKISATKGGNSEFPFHGEFGPFMNKHQAEIILKQLQALPETLWDKNTLEITFEKERWSRTTFTLEQVITYAKKLGIEIKMKDLLQQKRGAVLGKNLGI